MAFVLTQFTFIPVVFVLKKCMPKRVDVRYSFPKVAIIVKPENVNEPFP
jgi:hypothetical protein